MLKFFNLFLEKINRITNYKCWSITAKKINIPVRVNTYNTYLSVYSEARCSLYNKSIVTYLSGYNTWLSG